MDNLRILLIEIYNITNRGYKRINNGPNPFIQFVESFTFGTFVLGIFVYTTLLISESRIEFYNQIEILVGIISFLLFAISYHSIENGSNKQYDRKEIAMFRVGFCISMLLMSVSATLFTTPKIEIIFTEVNNIIYIDSIMNYLLECFNNAKLIRSVIDLGFITVIYWIVAKVMILIIKMEHVISVKYILFTHDGEKIETDELYKYEENYCILQKKESVVEKIIISKENVKNIKIIEDVLF